jgi:hypothetical protein
VFLDLAGEYRTATHVMRHYAARAGRLESWKNAISNPIRAGTALRERVAVTSADADPEEGGPSLGVRPDLSRAALEELLEHVVAGGPKALFAFTAGLEENYNYRGQFSDVFPTYVKSDQVDWDYIADANHSFSREAARKKLFILVEAWLVKHGFAEATPGE